MTADKTIAAISTALGSGGIGIIRISGSKALSIIYKIFLPINKSIQKISFKEFQNTIKSHQVYFGKIICEKNGQILDEAIIIYMKEPKSYTREDIVEIQVHSGIINLERILREVINAGAILAKPGEFTQRAFSNGRIDITQAEGIINLINANCEITANIASKMISGEVYQKFIFFKDKLTEIQAILENEIEFADNSDNNYERIISDIKVKLRKDVLNEVRTLIIRSKEKTIYNSGITLTLSGAPNVGKSSLLNKLVDNEAAIVSEIPGTTRDIVKEFLSINGLPIMACDTAGIHETKNPIELEGIKKAEFFIDKADIVLFIIDGSRKIDDYEKKFISKNANNAKNANKIVIFVINKIDLHQNYHIKEDDFKFNYPNIIKVSAKNGSGIDDLKQLIFRSITREGEIENDYNKITINLRQRIILEKVETELNDIIHIGEDHKTIDLISEKIKGSINLIDEITGEKRIEGLYNRIFEQFCIGK